MGKVILGTVQLGMKYGINNQLEQPLANEALDILNHAFSSGIAILDTAEAYGDAINIIAGFHRQNKGTFQVISKFRSSPEITIDQLREQLGNSLQKIGLPQYQVLMYHSFDDLRSGAYKGLLATLKKEGMIVKTGVSIYTNDELQFAVDDDSIDVIQLPFNLLDNHSQKGLHLKAAKEKGKEIHARSIFLQGLFMADQKNAPEKLQPLMPYIQRLHRIAEEHQMDIAALAMGYAFSRPYLDKVLIGIDNLEQLKMNIAHLDITIPDTAITAVNEIAVRETTLLNPKNW